MPQVYRALLSALILFALGSSGHAQVEGEPLDISERITVTATGDDAIADHVPVAVTVIPRDEIDNAQEESVADLIRRVPGVTVMRSGDEGAAASFFLRGTESDHVLALFDGVRLNSPYFGGYDWSLHSTAGAERIEVVRGPFSALWGADAAGGAVNVIPVRGSRESSLALHGAAGEGDWRRIEARVGWTDESWDLAASGFDREGRSDAPNSDFSNRQLLFHGGYAWNDGNRAAFVYQDLDGALGVPFSDPVTPSPRRRQETSERLAALPLHFAPAARWNLELVPSFVERELFFSDPDDTFGFTRSTTLADTESARLVSRHELPSAGGAHQISWGAEWRRDEVFARSNFGVDLKGSRSTISGLFMQDQWQPSTRWTLLAGARYDDASEFGSQFSPRVALGYQATDRVTLRASYGRAFRQPSIGELFFPGSGNPQLSAEHSESAEVGMTWRTGKARLELAVFRSETDDMINFEFTSFSFANIDSAEVSGAELSWSLPITKDVSSTLGATWLDSEDQNGQPLLRRPEWGASWTLRGRFGSRVRADLSAIFVGSRDDVDALTFGRVRSPSHTAANVAIAYRLGGAFALTARATNLLDRGYQEVNGFPAPGRRLIGGIRWSG